MVGILLALQVNNWNEQKKQIKELNSYAKSLSSDLIQDIEMVYVNIRQGKKNVMRVDSLARYTKDKSLDELSNLQLWLLTHPLSYRPYRWHRASLDELKNPSLFQTPTILLEDLPKHNDLPEDFLFLPIKTAAVPFPSTTSKI